MRLISLPTIPLWMALATNRTLLAGLAISMERFHLDSEDCGGGEFRQQSRGSGAGRLLPAMPTQKTALVGSSGSRFSGNLR